MDEEKRHCRILTLNNIPIFLPLDLDPDGEAGLSVVRSFLEVLLAVSPCSYSCLELPTLNYSVHQTIWATILSFIAFKQRAPSVPNAAAALRVVHVSSSFHSLTYCFKAVQDLRRKMKTTHFDSLRISTFGEPAEMCVNRQVLNRTRNRPAETNMKCRSLVRCKSCSYCTNLDDLPVKPIIEDFFDDIEDVSRQLAKASLCPYYAMVKRMPTSDVIFTTYGALHETLCGLRDAQESIPLNAETVLICEDSLLMDKILQNCYDFSISIEQIDRTLEVMGKRKAHIVDLQRHADGKRDRVAFGKEFDIFLRILTTFRDTLVDTPNTDQNRNTNESKVQLLQLLGIPDINPPTCHRILSSISRDVTKLPMRRRQKSMLLAAVGEVRQFFLDLANPDVAHCIFSDDPGYNCFRFWHVPRSTDMQVVSIEAEENQKKTMRFFSLSPLPGISALKRRGLSRLIAYGTLLPVSMLYFPPSTLSMFRVPTAGAISASKLFHGAFHFGPAPEKICFSGAFNSREEDTYKLALGAALKEIVAVVSDKVLIVFPSRAFYERCVLLWQSTDVADLMGLRLITDHPCLHRNEPHCWLCVKEIEKLSRFGYSVVCFARCAGMAGVVAGFEGIVAVNLPYLFRDDLVQAKECYLAANSGPDAKWSWYFQEAIHAITSVFDSATVFDPASERRGRVLLWLDARIKARQHQLPVGLQKSLRHFQNFEEGIDQLKEFLASIRDTAKTSALTSVKFVHPLMKNHVFGLEHGATGGSMEARRQLVIQLMKEIDQYRDDGNIDLLASRIIAALRVDRTYENFEFRRATIPWLFRFKHFLLNERHHHDWAGLVESVLKQVLEAINNPP